MYRDRPGTATRLSPSTLAVSAGRPRSAGSALNQPPVFASAFEAGEGPSYGRDSNPTWVALEAALGELEGGEAIAFGSGMATASAVIDSFRGGTRVAVGACSYVEVRELLRAGCERGALEVFEIDPLDTTATIAAAEAANVLWLDAISNPALDVPALDRILPEARARGALCVVDATLATPMLLRPLDLGADLVLHSASKYLGGHSDLLLGAAVAADPLRAQALRHRRSTAGSVPGTMEAWLCLRGMRTLALRMERGTMNAGVIAERLCRWGGLSVRYPGLPGDRSFERARRLLDGNGCVISFDLGSVERADRACDAVELITHAGSLGGVETVIERPARWHGDASVPEGLLRLSVGCEEPEDLWADLSRALSVAG
jgi:cystathionine gamma-synthase